MLRQAYETGFIESCERFGLTKEAARRVVSPGGAMTPAPVKPQGPGAAAKGGVGGFFGGQWGHAKDLGANVGQLFQSFKQDSPMAGKVVRQQALQGMGGAAKGLLPSAGILAGAGLIHHMVSDSPEEKRRKQMASVPGIGGPMSTMLYPQQ